MPVSVKCRTGKCEKYFLKLNPGEIDFFECHDCPADEVITAPSGDVAGADSETSSQKKARIKAEKKAKEEAEKSKAE